MQIEQREEHPRTTFNTSGCKAINITTKWRLNSEVRDREKVMRGLRKWILLF